MKIKVRLNSKSINEAYKQIETYRREIEQKTREFTEKLAYIGLKEASVRFTTAMYDGDNDVKVTLSKTSNGYQIEAEGKAVCFIEFGAGVYYNGTEPYPKPRPSEISKIGEYGKGKGKQQMWVYNKDDEKFYTHGNPAAMPMWYATKEMEQNILRIAREVFR